MYLYADSEHVNIIFFICNNVGEMTCFVSEKFRKLQHNAQ